MITLVQAGGDACEIAARRIVERCADRLPDLSHVVVIVSAMTAATRLRECLLAAAESCGHPALLGPAITTLREWVLSQSPPSLPAPGEHARELMLVEALRAHHGLFGGADPWTLAAELLELFSELTLSGEAPPDDPDVFTQRIARAYGGDGGLAPLGREARLVHTLWRAWHEQLAGEGLRDRDVLYIGALRDFALPAATLVVFVGLEALVRAEEDFIDRLVASRQAECLRYRETGGMPEDSFSAFLSAALDEREPDLAARARALATACPRSPATGRLVLCALPDAEAQALAIDVQVRIWLAEGIAPIGIVCGDRRLARRLRALLERAGIVLGDATGWALSTTSAAAALERWLEAVEEDFAYQPLLDALKSPFIGHGGDREAHLDAVHHLERDVILHEGVPRNLGRMREHLARRRRRLAAWAETTTAAVTALLDHIEHAVAPLAPIVDGRARPPAVFLDAIDESLDRLGMKTAFAADPAGQRILEEIAAMRADLTGRTLRMTWRETRGWLGRVLETRYFRPSRADDAPVRLLDLSQSALARFEGLVITGADAAHLPGGEASVTFFNDAVRRELGLETHAERTALTLTRFRRLLEAAPRVLVTRERERDGEPMPPSPWVEALDTVHRIAWNSGLEDEGLAALAADPRARVASPTPGTPPMKESMPTPTAPSSLLPQRLSASSHDDLIACPYRFFAARCLGLAPAEEIVETLRKSDYGSRVHRCLHAFHGGVDGLPGPFAGPLTEANRGAACALLEEISERVFARDLEDNFVHRAWLVRWRRVIAPYIDWAIERARDWQTIQTEVEAERPLNDRTTLYGRLDRIDRGAEGGFGILDYKTGSAPHEREVLSGESVQLPTYALLTEGIVQAEYLLIDEKAPRAAATIAGEELDSLTDAVRERLIGVMDRLLDGSEMPAHGTERACRHCDMAVVCRQAVWRD